MRNVIAWVLCALLAAGCATELNETQSGALLGAGLGAGTGAIIGNQTGHAGAGTAIGAGLGALAGGLAGEANRRTRERTKEEIRQELAAQRGYDQRAYAPAPGYAPAPQYGAPQPQYVAPAGATGEVHTKWNARTGQTFPESMQYDPQTGEQLQYIR